MIMKYFIAWFGMMVLAVLNGALRDFAYQPHLGELAGHQISTVILLLLLFAGYFRFLTRRWPIESGRQAWAIGTMWFLMTEAFEFGMILMTSAHPWDKIFESYSLFEGQVWLFVPLWVLIGPYVFYRLGRKDS
ncbi:MAG: hypothetical protein OEW15_07380 [Nitrospirota bacterium]|nr:hypothetical protein [Nitrospirota bacterium]